MFKKQPPRPRVPFPFSMPLRRPVYVQAGFHSDAPSPAVPELAHVGEEWLPAGSRIAMHAHAVWEFYLQIEGETEWEVAGSRRVLKPGTLLAVAPGVRHGLTVPAATAHHFFFAGIDIPAVLAGVGKAGACWRGAEPGFVRAAPEVGPAFRGLVREVTRRAWFREEALRFALGYLALELTRALPSSSGARSLLKGHPGAARARELMDNEPGRPWTVASLAERAGLSPGRLTVCFKAETGMTPHRYLMRRRIEAARALLRDSDRSITDIGLELGFASGQHFATVFGALAGRSPGAFRRGRAKG